MIRGLLVLIIIFRFISTIYFRDKSAKVKYGDGTKFSLSFSIKYQLNINLISIVFSYKCYNIIFKPTSVIPGFSFNPWPVRRRWNKWHDHKSPTFGPSENATNVANNTRPFGLIAPLQSHFPRRLLYYAWNQWKRSIGRERNEILDFPIRHQRSQPPDHYA